MIMIGAIFNPQSYFFNPYSLPNLISGILIMAESVFVFLQNRKSGVNISFSLATFSAGMWLTGIAFQYSSIDQSVALIWCRYYCWFGIIFITPYVYLFSCMWAGVPLRKNLKFIYLCFIPAIIFYILCISSDYIIQGVLRSPWGFYPKAAFGEKFLIVWFAMLALMSFANLVQSYKKETVSIRKSQVRLVIIAFILGFVGAIDFIANYGIPIYSLGGIFALLFSTIIGYTIVNYRLMEIETAIHKTIAWFFTSVALVGPLAALLYLTKDWYIKLSPAIMWGYFGAVLLGFMFFVTTFQPKIDNFFQKGRVYIENELIKFSGELIHLKSLEEVIAKITDIIIKITHASKVIVILYNEPAKEWVVAGNKRYENIDLELSIENPFLKWLAKNDRILNYKFVTTDPRYEDMRLPAEEYFKNLDVIMCAPLILNERLVGIINLGPKVNMKLYNSLDHQFLTRLKNQSTIAISNSLVYGRVEELIKIKTDELVKTQRQLVHAEKLATVGTLAGGVAHEINNPLTAVLMNAQMLLMTVKDKEDKESLQLIEEAAKRCRNIVQKLMVYSRKSMGTREITEVDLAKALDSVIKFLGYQLAQENIKVELKLNGGPFLVKGCQNELEQVFINMLLNAKDAIRKIKIGGRVIISISKNNDEIIIKVQDEGSGIPKEYATKIFDPFFTTKDVGKGTGLGLSISQSIIEEHNGFITFNTQEGKGTTFIIQLPALKK